VKCSYKCALHCPHHHHYGTGNVYSRLLAGIIIKRTCTSKSYHENRSPLQWQTHAGDTWRVKLCNVFAGVGIPSPCCSLSEGDFTKSQCSQLIIILNLKVGLLFWPNYSFPLRPDSGVFRLFGYFRSVISGKLTT